MIQEVLEVREEKFQEDPVFKEILIRIAGEHGYEVASELVGKEMTDDELAKKTGMRVNLVRKILYDLYDNRVVGYRRIRDENSGWYIYYWRIEPDRALEFYEGNKRLLLQKLQERLEQERSPMFFTCSDGCVKMPFDEAAEVDFKCPKCQKQLKPFENSDIVTALERQIESLKEHLAGS
jgi:transcription initiation factor TFIIE subunit alpha